MNEQKINKLNIGKNNSKRISNYINLIMKLITTYHPEVECVVMKNYFNGNEKKLETHLIYISSNNGICELKHNYERFDFKLNDNIMQEFILYEESDIDAELSQGTIIFDKTGKYYKLQQNKEYMQHLSHIWHDFDGLVEIVPPIVTEKSKKMKR